MSFEPFHWKCPHCKRETIVSEHNHEASGTWFGVESADGLASLRWRRITCPSPQCRKSEFTATLSKASFTWMAGRKIWVEREKLGRGKVRFLPSSAAETFPDFVPEGIRKDYEEACLIVDLSPKAAATLARRALQGIVRNFWQGTGRTLKDEIESVKAKCDPLVWGAMTAVREVGNIGAHMERDIDLIIEVDADEAQLLIQLIETLVRETYMARNARELQMNGLRELAVAKKQIKEPTAAASLAPPSGP